MAWQLAATGSLALAGPRDPADRRRGARAPPAAPRRKFAAQATDPPQQATVAFSARQISSILAGSSVVILSTSWPLAIVERLSKLVT